VAAAEGVRQWAAPLRLRWLPPRLRWLPPRLRWLPPRLRWLPPRPHSVARKIDYRGTASAADKTPVKCREGGTPGSRFTIEITARRRIVFLHTDDCTLGDFSPGEGTRLSGIADTSSPGGGRSVWISFLGPRIPLPFQERVGLRGTRQRLGNSPALDDWWGSLRSTHPTR
jgi:hypothetical protein